MSARKAKTGRVRPPAPAADQSSVEIDGKRYRLSWDFNVVADAEQEIGGGLNLLHGVAAISIGTQTAWQFRGILYAALRSGGAAVTLQQTGALIRPDTMPAISRALYSALGITDVVAQIAALMTAQATPDASVPQ